ncbi:MAG TPA: Gfo/Idh/MocA family oxidoreductase [Jatrophihabitans sp.]|nr:Gfo/Idh/MocA family oxidoreductase [Jatrophihabitans sp.]
MPFTPSAQADPGLSWAVLGTANIAAKAFLPALRAAGGHAELVGSRDPDRASGWAERHGVGAAVRYQDVLEDERIDAVYIALPNDEHIRWAARAAAAGKAVLCEKPLAIEADEVATLTTTGQPLIWEAFVFPFHPQTDALRQLLADGAVAEVTELQSEFHFVLRDRGNLRFSTEHGGGALFDVGCYPIRLARLLFGTEPVQAAGLASFDPAGTGEAIGLAGAGVDIELAAALDFAAGSRLLLSAGFRRGPSTFTRVLGTGGELRLSNPFHPTPADGIELWRDGRLVERWPAAAGTAFEHAIRHVQRAVAGVEPARHTVAADGLAQARALALARAAISRQGEPAGAGS